MSSAVFRSCKEYAYIHICDCIHLDIYMCAYACRYITSHIDNWVWVKITYVWVCMQR